VRYIAALLLLANCASVPPPAQTPARATIAPPQTNALWFVHAEEDDGTVIVSQNGDKLLVPASNRKLFAAAAIASCLGLDTQLHTEVWLDGEDLVVVGDGDPSLGSWRYDRIEDFNHVAELLLARGVTRVRDVIADVSRFDRVTIPGSWKHGNLGSDYAAPVDAITWGESEIPTDRAVPDPGLHAAQALRDALFSRGITTTGVARVNTAPRAWTELITTMPSPFIYQLLGTVLKNSHNLYTEMLLKRSAYGTYDLAFARERLFLTGDVGVPNGEFHFVDGSGLSPEDVVTPRAIITMLRWMNDPARRGVWWSLLAQPANEGTLRRRMVTLEHRMRGKTGTINGVIALSGILAMPDGRFRYFSIAVNHDLGDDDVAQRAIDGMVEKLASLSF
jgi:D-alanyl-D-alanine carboxypeptidase/D-alanyl-D-alanine-endopeptidase (penicillin-binding protein 4)